MLPTSPQNNQRSAPKQVTYIAVAGNIGCGKSTLVDFICRTYGLQPFFEPNQNNPYLVDFYADMRTWAIHSQLYFLTHKFRIHRELEHQRLSQTVVQDRTIYEDAEVFATYLHRRRFINQRDWGLYQDLYTTIAQVLRPPDLMIYLKASVRTIRQRIKLRGRAEEQKIPVAYLRSLNGLYEEWLASYKRSPCVVLETDKLDYLTDLVDRLDLRKAIEQHL
ncbi:MAG: deoxynucleoside kinase [Myxococcota bacterium]